MKKLIIAGVATSLFVSCVDTDKNTGDSKDSRNNSRTSKILTVENVNKDHCEINSCTDLGKIDDFESLVAELDDGYSKGTKPGFQFQEQAINTFTYTEFLNNEVCKSSTIETKTFLGFGNGYNYFKVVRAPKKKLSEAFSVCGIEIPAENQETITYYLKKERGRIGSKNSTLKRVMKLEANFVAHKDLLDYRLLQIDGKKALRTVYRDELNQRASNDEILITRNEAIESLDHRDINLELERRVEINHLNNKFISTSSFRNMVISSTQVDVSDIDLSSIEFVTQDEADEIIERSERESFRVSLPPITEDDYIIDEEPKSEPKKEGLIENDINDKSTEKQQEIQDQEEQEEQQLQRKD